MSEPSDPPVPFPLFPLIGWLSTAPSLPVHPVPPSKATNYWPPVSESPISISSEHCYNFWYAVSELFISIIYRALLQLLTSLVLVIYCHYLHSISRTRNFSFQSNLFPLTTVHEFNFLAFRFRVIYFHYLKSNTYNTWLPFSESTISTIYIA